jgi:predicted transcriptional regulator
MKKTSKPIPTEQELEILKVIWERGEATVREVYNDLRQRRSIAYTTVLTMMGILERKGHVTKSPGQRAYIYKPAQVQGRVVQSMVKEFVGRVFNGSAKSLLVHLLQEQETAPKDLDEIEALLKERRRRL